MGRFIPGLSLVTVIMGGVIGFNKSVALSLIAFSSFVHEAVFFFIGCVIGSNKLYITKFISIYNIFFIGILVLMVLLFVFKKFLKKEKRN
jgi:membrane protein DedA with SNARE-associated domain